MSYYIKDDTGDGYGPAKEFAKANKKVKYKLYHGDGKAVIQLDQDVADADRKTYKQLESAKKALFSKVSAVDLDDFKTPLSEEVK